MTLSQFSLTLFILYTEVFLTYPFGIFFSRLSFLFLPRTYRVWQTVLEARCRMGRWWWGPLIVHPVLCTGHTVNVHCDTPHLNMESCSSKSLLLTAEPDGGIFVLLKPGQSTITHCLEERIQSVGVPELGQARHGTQTPPSPFPGCLTVSEAVAS